MTPSETTQVSIAGERTTLLFGARYRVRYGKDDRVLVDAKLVERAKNGDLIFDELETLADAKRVRVRPSTIDSIFGSGTEAPSVTGDRHAYQDRGDGRCTICGIAFTKTGDHFDGAVPVSEARLDGAPPVDYGTTLGGPVGRSYLDADQAETDRLVEEFVADGDHDPDSVAAKVEAEKRRRRGDHSDERAANVAQRKDGESASDFLARMERSLGKSYVDWTGTDYGQKILAEVAADDQAKRNGKPILSDEERSAIRTSIVGTKAIDDPTIPPEHIADEYVALLPKKVSAKNVAAAHAYAVRVVVDHRIRSDAPKLGRKGREKLVAAGADPEAVAAATSAEDVPGVVVAKGRPYSQRNKVWRCGTCKRRLRLAECTGPADAPHEAVAAPAGKRKDDR